MKSFDSFGRVSPTTAPGTEICRIPGSTELDVYAIRTDDWAGATIGMWWVLADGTEALYSSSLAVPAGTGVASIVHNKSTYLSSEIVVRLTTQPAAAVDDLVVAMHGVGGNHERH